MGGGGGGDALQHLSAVQNMGLGALSGVCSKVVNYPLLVWKNAAQQNLPLPKTPSLLYRGLPVACANLGGTTAAQFFATGFFQKLIGTEGMPLNDTQRITSAFLGGLASGVPCSIWELTMIQQQRFGGSVLAANARLVKEYGFTSIFRGMTTTLGRESMFTMAMLGMTPVIQETMIEKFNLNSNLGLAVGALSGSIFSATATHPLDTIKTCMQGDVEQVKYKTVRASGQSLIDEFGVARGLFKGLGWRISLITTTFFLVNKFKETLVHIV